jgi:hypothetical protein
MSLCRLPDVNRLKCSLLRWLVETADGLRDGWLLCLQRSLPSPLRGKSMGVAPPLACRDNRWPSWWLIVVFATIVAIASARSSVGSSGQQMAFNMVDCCVCNDRCHRRCEASRRGSFLHWLVGTANDLRWLLHCIRIGGAMPNLFPKRTCLAPKMGIFYSTPN